MPEMVVVKDKVGYVVWDERLRRYTSIYKSRGERHDFPDSAIARFEQLAENSTDPREKGRPHVLSVEDYEAYAEEQTRQNDPAYALTDDQLMALKADDLIAQLNSVPGLAGRVLDLEQARPRTRKPIVAHCERILAAEGGADVSLSDPQTEASLTPSEA